MRETTRGWLAFGLWLLAGTVLAQPAPLPPALADWREWVLRGHETSTCPVRDGDEALPACRWPGLLALDVDAQGASFVQTWTLDAAQRVPLPGSGAHRPLAVEIDGRAAPVVLHEGQPALALPAGTHRVAGRIAWARRPATLALPDDVALLALRLDGAVVARPERNEEGELVLGEVGADESDALRIELYRLLADGVPQLLATRVDLSVSGTPREVVLPPLLPEGFVPIALEGGLPARLEPDGRLRLQLRPGYWPLTVVARAAQPRETFALPADSGTWPAQEIWQFRADPLFRAAQLTGLPGVDPKQISVADWDEGLEDVAAAWRQQLADADELPAFLFERGAEAKLEIALRGMPANRPPRLHLQRELWLDFDGDAFSATDHIRGELAGAARLDLRAPWTMQRAQQDDDGLLITRGVAADTQGVELRHEPLDLEVDARVARDALVAASGWTQPFDSARMLLQLPPGYRLLAATGADRAGGSWWQAWRLADLFLLSLSVLLAWRLGGLRLSGLALAWGVLAWHEPDAPRWSVFALLLLALVARHLVGGWAGRIARALQGVALLAAGGFGLAFAATELRLALYPQLEPRSVDAAGGAADAAVFSEAAPQAPMPAAAPPPQRMAKQAVAEQAELERIEVTGSRIKRADLFSYPADAIVQSGTARPDWNWHAHPLEWQGPLLPDDALGLLISPPPLTRLWRVAAVLLLAALLWQVLRPMRRRALPSAPAAVAWLVLGAGAAWPIPTLAQATPDPALLEELRARLARRDEPCRPECAGLGEATVVAAPGSLQLALSAQAQALVVWPLPRPDASLALVEVRVDGTPAAVLRDDAGDWLRLERGVHRIDARYAPQGERWRLAFPLPPATLRIEAPSFEAVGVDRGRLVGDTLELIAPRGIQGSAATEDAAPSEAIPPFVRVLRVLDLDQHWELTTTVTRVAPLRSGINLSLPLLPGEQPFAAAPPIRDGRAVVALPAGVDSIQWRSRLTPQPAFTFTAGDGREYAEEWVLAISPLLHVESSGLPEAGEEEEEAALRRFLPLPGEALQLAVTRPEAIAGARFAIENVTLGVVPGRRARDARLSFDLRATQSGQHHIALPAKAELLQFRIDGEEQPRVLEEGRLRLPLAPGEQRIEILWREPIALGLRVETPALELGTSAANLRLEVQAPAERWLLLARGPRVGPAVMLWGELAVMALAAFALARFGGTPLRLHHWLLLGLGFSTMSWLPAALVAAWLVALGWRARRADLVERRFFPWLQLGLGALSALALLALLVAVPYGLLGQPDMRIAGNGSDAWMLRWFADRSDDGALPLARIYSLPLWLYKLAVLLWSVWLANALLGWLRWGWDSLGRGGRWRPLWRQRAVTVPPGDVPPG